MEAGYEEKLQSLRDRKVFELIPCSEVSKDRKIRHGHPVFTLKRDENGKPTRYKVRIVFKGYEQVYGRDYTMTTLPTAWMEMHRVLLGTAATHSWDAQQVDVKTAFLHGILSEEETQYMEQMEGYRKPGKENWIWKITHSLYGMKQAGRVWNKTLDAQMEKWGFKHLECESCVYYRKTEHGTVIVSVHVDDFLSISDKKEKNDRFLDDMEKVWKISRLRTPKHLVGMGITWDHPNKIVKLSQTALIDKIIAQFGQCDVTPLSILIDQGLKLR